MELPFRCPACRAVDWAADERRMRCGGCDREYPVREGTVHFTGSGEPVVLDPLDRLKYRVKRFRRFYALLVWLFSPLFFDGTRRRFVADRVGETDGLFVNLGSGNTRLHERVVNVDLTPYDEVDVVSDLLPLPFASDSIDGVFSISVLEHVPDPEGVIREVHRVLKPGGWVYTDVPFVVGYHASPRDYHRWTREGLEELHREFATERIVQNGGPTSAMLWIVQEWIALVLSLGSRRLHTVVYPLVLIVTFPVKFLDLLLNKVDLGANIASCFIYVGRKPDG